MKTIFYAISLMMLATGALANAGEHELKHVDWSFDGVLGKVDKQSAQRGLQVYKEVCSACHGLERVAFRSLTEIGLSEAETKVFSSGYTVKDGPNDMGEMFDRPGRPSDHFVSPHPNEQAARAAHNGAYPPDLSLIIKARHDGGDYIYSLLTGYDQTLPAEMHLSDGQYYNPYFPGGKLAMPAPLLDGQVSYQDGTIASADQMAKDVVNFLQWAAEPEMESRKQMGLKVMAYLAILTAFLYVSMKRVWSKIH